MSETKNDVTPNTEAIRAAARGEVMSTEEFDRRLRVIAEIAKRQREGPYDARSDAMQALSLIETMAILLVENAEAQR